MNFLLLVTVLAVAALGVQAHVKFNPEMMEMLENLQKTCVAETGVDLDVIEEAKKEKKNITPDPHFKCFLKCMMVNMQWLTEDGVFDKEAVMNHIPDEMKGDKAEQTIDSCKHLKGDDACDTAFLLVKCFADKWEDSYIFK